MASSSLFRIGGIAGILSIVLIIGYAVWPPLLAVGALVLAVFIFALYRLFSPGSPMLSLVGAAVGIGGAVILAVMLLIRGDQNAAPQNLALWASMFFPPLVFGLAAWQQPKVGMPRPLAIIGLVGGVFGLVNLLLTLAGGGNWSQPNNPALAMPIMLAYYVATLATLVWMVWTGIILVRMKPAAAAQPA